MPRLTYLTKFALLSLVVLGLTFGLIHAGLRIEAALALAWVLLAAIAARAFSRFKHQVAESERLALHDPVTELPNRILFHDRAQQAIAARGCLGPGRRGAAARPEPLQGGQRHARPSQRRPPAGAGRQAARAGAAPGRRCRRASRRGRVRRTAALRRPRVRGVGSRLSHRGGAAHAVRRCRPEGRRRGELRNRTPSGSRRGPGGAAAAGGRRDVRGQARGTRAPRSTPRKATSTRRTDWCW